MKKIFIFILVFFLTGCTLKVYEVPFHQDKSNICKIEVYDNRASDEIIILTLKDEAIPEFVESLEKVRCYRYFNDPPMEYGKFAIYVYYSDGTIDVLGTDICDYISVGEQRDPWIRLDYDDVIELLSSYIGNIESRYSE